MTQRCCETLFPISIGHIPMNKWVWNVIGQYTETMGKYALCKPKAWKPSLFGFVFGF